MSANLSASILARLLALAKQRGDDYSLLLNRFALERLLARLSMSAHSDRFLLKGALLFALWYDVPHRPTRDADLLGFGADDEANLISTFCEIAAMALNDGIIFDPDSVQAQGIREDNTYGGTRMTLAARIGSARCALQIDVGFGDAVTPGPSIAAYPTLLADFEPPTLRVYPVYTVIAEKYQAMVTLGQANTRMKDFFDLAVIARRTPLHGATLADAIAATSARRQTALPKQRPLALSRPFGEDVAKQRQWQAFLAKNRIQAASLSQTVALLDDLLWPPTQVAATASQATATWDPESLRWHREAHQRAFMYSGGHSRGLFWPAAIDPAARQSVTPVSLSSANSMETPPEGAGLAAGGRRLKRGGPERWVFWASFGGAVQRPERPSSVSD